MDKTAELVLAPLVGVAAIVFYIVMVVHGVKIAKRKGRSPHWMWFALHPLSGVIAYICLRRARPLQRCPRCSTRVPVVYEVCPACRYAFAESIPQKGATIPTDGETSAGLVRQDLSELKKMLDLGLITQPEFDEKKKQILSKM